MKQEAYDCYLEHEESHWWFSARRKIILDLVRRCIPPGSRVLDYGCCYGFLSRLLEEEGYRVTAADLTDATLNHCRKHGPQTVLDLRKDAPETGGYDAILFLDVMEHIADDIGELRRLSTYLKPEGRILITVPAYHWLWSGEDVVSNHVRRYSRSSLRGAINDAGLRILKVSYFNSLLFPAVVTVIMLKRIFMPGSLARSNVSRVSPPINHMLFAIFSFERFLLRYSDFRAGASILAVCKRS